MIKGTIEYDLNVHLKEKRFGWRMKLARIFLVIAARIAHTKIEYEVEQRK